MPRKILMMTANPTDTATLKLLNDEIAAIHEGLSAAQHRDQFQFVSKNNLNIRELRRMMLKETPQIVHFSGHGAGESGIMLQDDFGKTQMVNADALSEFFKQFTDSVECVVLNACYSEVQAKAISQYIPYVIGMSNAIGDKAACEFSAGFYDALGAGKTIPFAFNIACNAIQMAGIKDQHLLPVLLSNPNAAQKQPPMQPSMRETPPIVAPSKAIIAKVSQLLRSLGNLQTENGRRALMLNAQLDRVLIDQIEVSQPVSTFVPIIVELLANHGTMENDRHALEALLTAARALGGKEFKQQCDAIFIEWLGRVPEAISAEVAQEPSIVETPIATPRSSVSDLKRKRLEQELALYQQQYEVVSRQKINDLNTMNQVKLQHQLDDLEREMQKIEQQLSQLS